MRGVSAIDHVGKAYRLETFNGNECCQPTDKSSEGCEKVIQGFTQKIIPNRCRCRSEDDGFSLIGEGSQARRVDPA